MSSFSQTEGRTVSGFGTGAAGGYVLCLDGVRAASILLVLLAHTAPLGPQAWLFNGMAGRMGMALFFCLSGYLITTMLYRDPDVLPFITKRLMRIVPALFLYLTFLLIFFDLPLKSYVLNLLFLTNYLVVGMEGGPLSHLWSLCVEVHFYLAISLAVLIGGRNAVWLVFPAALLVTWMRIETGTNSNINTHLRVDEILVGGWLGLIALHFGDRLRRALANPVLAWGLIVGLSVLFMVSSHDNGPPVTYLRPYIAMTLVGVIMHCDLRTLLNILESRVAQYIARISYALYIWHPLMVFGWMSSGSTLEKYLLKRPVSWTLTWVAAHVSTHYWEVHWQRLARRLVKSRGQGAQPRKTG